MGKNLHLIAGMIFKILDVVIIALPSDQAYATFRIHFPKLQANFNKQTLYDTYILNY